MSLDLNLPPQNGRCPLRFTASLTSNRKSKTQSRLWSVKPGHHRFIDHAIIIIIILIKNNNHHHHSIYTNMSSSETMCRSCDGSRGRVTMLHVIRQMLRPDGARNVLAHQVLSEFVHHVSLRLHFGSYAVSYALCHITYNVISPSMQECVHAVSSPASACGSCEVDSSCFHKPMYLPKAPSIILSSLSLQQKGKTNARDPRQAPKSLDMPTTNLQERQKSKSGAWDLAPLPNSRRAAAAPPSPQFLFA